MSQFLAPPKKNCKKEKWLSEEALQIAEKRREAQGKGEKERYTHLNAEVQRIARRDKKAFLSDQCKEIEENNRLRKTRNLFKKIRDTKGTFQAKMSTIKDRNGMDLTEAEDIKKRWQEHREELCKKDLHDPHNHDGIIILSFLRLHPSTAFWTLLLTMRVSPFLLKDSCPHLEPDILECEVKWTLGSITTNKASGNDGNPSSLNYFKV